MRVLQYSQKAAADLEATHDRIAEDNPLRAATFIEEILQRLSLAVLFPMAAPQAPDRDASQRVISFEDYLIFYKIEPERILVTTVFHAALDLTEPSLH